MKESYFTRDSICEKSREMLSNVLKIRRRREELTLPDDLALLVLDMQDFFLTKKSHAFVPSSAAICPGVQALVTSFQKNKLPVVFTRHLNTLQNAGSMARWWQDVIREENPLSDITKQLRIGNAPVFIKSQYDAFYETDLEKWLNLHGIKHVLICGVMTHLCCETTARSAFMRGFGVWFTIDGTATYSEEFHKASLATMAHGFAHPVLVEEVI
ncbi:MAG: cysteine hydrolase, partial [Anaerolineaceae bacterium]|nr:cysteine hydrolase [Anaerolineaceae bacterium]